MSIDIKDTKDTKNNLMVKCYRQRDLRWIISRTKQSTYAVC